MDNKTDKILNSLSGLQKAEAPDFFYTRLHATMQNKMQENTKPFFLLKPVFITTVLFIFLIANVFSIIKFNKATIQNVSVQSHQPATLQSFAEAYNFNTEVVYE